MIYSSQEVRLVWLEEEAGLQERHHHAPHQSLMRVCLSPILFLALFPFAHRD